MTTGPGRIHALNGVYGALTVSIPILLLTGQVECETYLRGLSDSILVTSTLHQRNIAGQISFLYLSDQLIYL